jgi:hypothetical protein
MSRPKQALRKQQPVFPSSGQQGLTKSQKKRMNKAAKKTQDKHMADEAKKREEKVDEDCMDGDEEEEERLHAILAKYEEQDGDEDDC